MSSVHSQQSNLKSETKRRIRCENCPECNDKGKAYQECKVSFLHRNKSLVPAAAPEEVALEEVIQAPNEAHK